MKLILYPEQHADAPEGMLHAAEDPCPFDSLGHPRGSTCCSFDATGVQDVHVKSGGFAFAELLNRDLNAADTCELAQILRVSFINLIVFHHGYTRGNVPQRHPMVRGYEEAREHGAAYPDWSFDEFARVLKPVGQAAEWLYRLGKRRHGVHVVDLDSRHG